MRYFSLACQDLNFDEFRAMIREYAPEVEAAVMTIAEQMRREGLAEGRVQERVHVLTKQLTLKFGSVDAEHEARIKAATPEELDRYVERILNAETLAAVFAE